MDFSPFTQITMSNTIIVGSFELCFLGLKKSTVQAPLPPPQNSCVNSIHQKVQGQYCRLLTAAFTFSVKARLLLLILGRWLVRHVRHTVMTVLYLKNKWSKMSFFPFLTLLETKKLHFSLELCCFSHNFFWISEWDKIQKVEFREATLLFASLFSLYFHYSEHDLIIF